MNCTSAMKVKLSTSTSGLASRARVAAKLVERAAPSSRASPYALEDLRLLAEPAKPSFDGHHLAERIDDHGGEQEARGDPGQRRQRAPETGAALPLVFAPSEPFILQWAVGRCGAVRVSAGRYK